MGNRGEVWLKTSSGLVFHLPADRRVNHPTTAIPWDFIRLDGVDTSTRLQVDHPELGVFYIEFALRGRTGHCKKCGKCCPKECEHLTEDGKCSVRDRILDGWKGCLLWPQHPNLGLPDECGFTFPEGNK